MSCTKEHLLRLFLTALLFESSKRFTEEIDHNIFQEYENSSGFTFDTQIPQNKSIKSYCYLSNQRIVIRIISTSIDFWPSPFLICFGSPSITDLFEIPPTMIRSTRIITLHLQNWLPGRTELTPQNCVQMCPKLNIHMSCGKLPTRVFTFAW